MLGYCQEDPEGQEYPKTGVLDDYRCTYRVYDIVALHVIHFWNT